MSHVYEIELESPQVWIKLQASCRSVEQAAAFLGHRFGGCDPDPDRPELECDSPSFRVPRRLAECVDHIANWASIEDHLPGGWESSEFRLANGPYAWCESKSEDCDCRGDRGRLDLAYCSDFGTPDEAERSARKSRNVWRAGHIQSLRDILTKRQEAQRSNRETVVREPQREPKVQLFHCPVHREHHEYSQQTQQVLEAQLLALRLEIKAAHDRGDTTFTTIPPEMSEILRRRTQAKECANALVADSLEVPEVVYKYLPSDLIGKGPPGSLRATQILALNDKMECNFVTTTGDSENVPESLSFARSRVEEHLGTAISEEELLERAVTFGDMRLSTLVQEFLNPRVGVVSLSTDILVPTMWSHYARNTGVVVGYDSKVLRRLGLELRPVHYSEMAPVYEPARDDAIQLHFPDLERLEDDARSGREFNSTPILVSAELARMGAGWKNLSRLLFTKGQSWAYEKEVRLLVDLQEARDTGSCNNGWPIKVIDIPPDAIVEIHGSDSTDVATVRRTTEAARGDNLNGLLVGHLSSYAFRMQRTSDVRH